MNYIDLFSGIGGFHLGLLMAGFKFNTVFYSDIDNYANKVYAMNFPDAIPLGDITKICPYILPKIDIVTAGFPCQDISVAGKQKGIKGERSGLFYEIIRLCSVLRPGIMFLENVPNLITGGNGLWFKSILGAIAEIGYDAEWQIISAASVGARHRRDRVWIVAYASGTGRKTRYFNGMGNKKQRSIPITRTSNVADTNEQHGNSGGFCASNVSQFKASGVQKSKQNVTNTQSKGLQNGDAKSSRTKTGSGVMCGFKRCDWWAVEPELGRVAHGIPRRVDRLKCLGNAVVPQVVQLIGEMILESGIFTNSN